MRSNSHCERSKSFTRLTCGGDLDTISRVACRLLVWSQPAFVRSVCGSRLFGGLASDVVSVSQSIVLLRVKTSIEAVVLSCKSITTGSIEEIVMRKVTGTLAAALLAVLFSAPAFARPHHHSHHHNYLHHHHHAPQGAGSGSSGSGSTRTGSGSGGFTPGGSGSTGSSSGGTAAAGTGSTGTSGFSSGGSSSGASSSGSGQ